MNENDIVEIIRINLCAMVYYTVEENSKYAYDSVTLEAKLAAKKIMDKIKEDEKPVSFNSNWNEDIDR